MENRRILSWRSCSPIRKGSLIGAFVGLTITIVPFLVFSLVTVEPFFAAGVSLTISFPAWCIYRILGWEEVYRSPVPWHFTATVVIANTCLLAIVGGLIARVITLFKARSKKGSSEKDLS